MSHLRFPRQSAASSGAAPSSNVGSSATTSAAATDLTSVFSSSTSNAPESSSLPPTTADATTTTTTSTSAAATSSSQFTPSSHVNSSTANASSSTPTTSSSSIAPSTTPSAASLSSSIPPSTTTTQPPPPSSTFTTITSSYTTYINGSQVVTQVSFPSTIPAPPSTSTSSDRAAIIGGSAAGGTAIFILFLSLAFCARRKRFKRLNFVDTIMRNRKRIHSRATLLDGEDLADVDLQQTPRRYTDYETPWDGSVRTLTAGRVTPGTPRTHKRQSETGSAFREDVWPPPHEGTQLIDPLPNRDDLDVDLGRIVDDVMGPSATAGHYSDRSVSSMYRDSVAVSDGAIHSRTVSTSSNAALLEAAGLGGPSGTAPVRSSPLANPENKPGSAEH